jgi:cell division protein FtsN
MNLSKWILIGYVVVLAFALMMTTGCTKQESEQEEKQEAVEQEEKIEVELPAAVVKAIEDNVPNTQETTPLNPNDVKRLRMVPLFEYEHVLFPKRA